MTQRDLPKTLLIIEDEIGIQNIVKRVFAPVYPSIQIADHSEMAIDMIQQATLPTDIYSDFNIFGSRNGLEIAKITADVRTTIGGRLSMFSSGRSIEDIEAIRQEIAIGSIHKFLHKPFTLTELKTAFLDK